MTGLSGLARCEELLPGTPRFVTLLKTTGMSGGQLNNLEKLEDDLWKVADQLRANSGLNSSEYYMPVLGVLFLRHATNRYNAVLREIEADQASGKMPKRPLKPADFLS